nr:bifunctional hydroxymethylpyrimidine kinase/phosphomethylpyrimidine kinase [Streptoalloteichus tenebrarius]
MKAFSALGTYATTVLVGLTAQNTTGVSRVHDVPLPMVAAQLDAVLTDVAVGAVKIGTTWSPDVVELVADRLSGLAVPIVAVPIVVDPVLVTASGSALGGGQEAVTAVRRCFLPLATVITPNLGEAQRLAGTPGEDDPARIAERLVDLGARAVLITDARPDTGGDWLFDGERHHPVPGRRHDTHCEHGAGCTHSSVLAVLLARGLDLPTAAQLAHRVAARAVETGHRDVGSGRHPVDVFAAVRDAAVSKQLAEHLEGVR